MTFSIKGRLTFSPGSRMTRRGSPNCSTSASSVWSTMSSELIVKTPTATSTTATTVRIRRLTTPSLLTAAQGWDGGCRRLWRRRRRCPRGGRRARRSTDAAQGGQRQVGKHPVSALGGFVDDHFVAALQDLLHGLEIEALESDILRYLEGAIDRGETIGVALGAGDDLLAIGLRFLLDRHGGAARPRDDIVAIGLCFVAQLLAIGKRALHVAEGIDDRGRRIDPQQLQLGDFDTSAIGVEDPLQQMLSVRLDLAPPFGQRLSDRGLADHLAHCALGGGFDSRVRRPNVEEIGPSVLDDPENGEVDVDDILVTGEHQRFFGHLAGPRPAGYRTLGVAVADLGPVDTGHARRQHLLDRARKMVIEAGLGRPVVGAKAQHDPDFVGQHAVDPARQPYDEDRDRDDGDPGPGTKAARQHAPEPVLTAPQKLLEVGGLRAAPATARPPATAAIAAPRAAAARTAAPRATALTLPEHRPRPFRRVAPGPPPTRCGPDAAPRCATR